MKKQHEASRDGDTRAAVVALLMRRGQATAADIGSALSITPTAARRHLENLSDAGDVTTASPSGSAARGRGRPAKEFLLTPAGRRRLRQGYDTLAIEALRTLREVGGDEAVRAFAQRRAEQAIGTIGPSPSDTESPMDPVDGAFRIAASLSDAGFSADAREVGAGVQICQHHCPVSEVASEFPELCEAEISAIEQALGTHVQRLATIANGDRACTTHVPVEYVDRRATPAKELR